MKFSFAPCDQLQPSIRMDSFNAISLPVQIVLLLLTYGAAKLVYVLFIKPLASPLRDFPAPPRTSIVFGNLKEILGE